MVVGRGANKKEGLISPVEQVWSERPFGFEGVYDLIVLCLQLSHMHIHLTVRVRQEEEEEGHVVCTPAGLPNQRGLVEDMQHLYSSHSDKI